MKRIVFLRAARSDIDRIFDYTAEHWDLDQATRYTGELHAACNALARGDRQGRPVDVRPGCLKYPAGSHVIYFREHDDRLEVVRILHGRMDVNRRL
jgi:toxin ParE1/3/4